MCIQKKLSGPSKYASHFHLQTSIPTLSVLKWFLMSYRISKCINMLKAGENYSSACESFNRNGISKSE